MAKKRNEKGYESEKIARNETDGDEAKVIMGTSGCLRWATLLPT